MRLLRYIRAEAAHNLRAIAIMSSLSAVSVATMLWAVASAAEASAKGEFSLRLLAMFALSAALFAVCHSYVAIAASRGIETVIDRLRTRLFDDIAGADPLSVNDVGRAALQDALVNDTQVLARTLPLLVIGGQQVALLVFLALYLLYLSPAACFLAFGFAILMLAFRTARVRQLGHLTRAAKASEMRVFDRLTDLLKGFKEVRMSRARARDLLWSVQQDSAASAKTNTAAKARWGREFAILQSMSFVLIALMVFAAPLIAADFHKVVVPATIAALYLVGPLGTLAQITPLIGEAEQALAHVETLSERLRPEDLEPAAEAVVLVQPREIALRKAVFSYRDAKGEAVFTIGPISARFRAGNITFVTGGNGSGKSTLLKALAGLFPLDGGELLLNGKEVDPRRRQTYRNLISAVFTDYHLSRRLYGIENPDPGRKRALLDELGLGGKTDIKDGAFTAIDLSTGQRKRLAFLVTELEDKPIIVLDELAADQDPPMRREFYEKILPSLKARGKIVICATHDDRWFHLADRVYRLEEGRLRRQRTASRE